MLTSMYQTNRYAVVDLEATETGSQAKIIQIGIVVIESGQIVETYETDINPHESISPHIQQLTGLTNKRLAKAPDFGEVAARIFQLIGDAIFVAHNVRFDANLLAEELFLEGFELRTPRVDTVELAQVFFPSLEKYNLVSLSHSLGLRLDKAHTAISDAHATAQLLLRIQDKISRLPSPTIEQILALADSFLFESRLVIEEVYQDHSAVVDKEYMEVAGLYLRAQEDKEEEETFSTEFRVNRSLLHLEERLLQEEFVACVEKRLTGQGKVHFIEAQAGIGKTYGYLLPLLAQTKEKILVSVPTKILQDQIMEKEGVALRDTFHLTIESVKSSRNYIDIEAFYHVLQEQDNNRLVNRLKLQILVWLCETQTGDLAELKQKYRYPALFDRIRHQGHVRADSLFAEGDFWRRLHSRAQRSRVLLTNHSYLLHHVNDQPYLMEKRILVVDEAQKLLLAAEELSSCQLAISPVVDAIETAIRQNRSLLEKRLLESCLFELEQFVASQAGKRMPLSISMGLDQLRQDLSELPFISKQLDYLQWFLNYYDQFWLEKEKENQTLLLKANQLELLDVASLFSQDKIFCISAGLELSSKVSLADLMGFKEVTLDRITTQKDDHQQVFLFEDGLEMVDHSLQEQAREIIAIVENVQILEKPVLILFTSIALLQAVSDCLDDKEISHLAQHRHGDEQVLKRRFEKGEANILLGTGLFWEGVDFAQQKEMIVIIPRLPFDNPKDFFVQKMNRYLKRQGKQPFYEYSLPVMLLKLRQAIGRSKRFEGQVSAVLILDQRTKTKRYSRLIRTFLKRDHEVKEISLSETTKQLTNFFAKDRK